MTPQEIQQSIEGLLSVQRGLQETQLAHETRLERLETNSVSLIQAIERMIQAQSETFVIVREMQAEVRTISAEVKGLQTENRRILDRFFGEQSN